MDGTDQDHGRRSDRERRDPDTPTRELHLRQITYHRWTGQSGGNVEYRDLQPYHRAPLLLEEPSISLPVYRVESHSALDDQQL